MASSFDLPFSFAADSLLLPIDVVDWWRWSTPDPLKGWTYQPFTVRGRHGWVTTNALDQAINVDYQAYIAQKKLVPLSPVSGFYEDGKGQKAIEFEALVSENESWHFAIIYNEQNKRVKVVRFGRSIYMC